MKDLTRISDSEWKVIKVLWSKPYSTANDVFKNLEKGINWKLTTVKTLLSRLVTKGAADYEKRNRMNYYYPLVTKDECIKAESKSFLKKVYDGALKSMIINFLEIQELSREEIDELKDILQNKRD